MGKTEEKSVKPDWVTALFLLFLMAALFAAYPRVLIYPPGVSAASHWFSPTAENASLPFFSRFPIEILVGALSLFYLASSFIAFRKVPRKTIMAVVLFLLAIGGSVIVNGTLPEAVVLKLNFILVPLAVGFAVLRSGILNQSRSNLLLYSLFLLWLVSVSWSFISGRPVGISGNRNWFVSVLLVTAPWAYFAVYHIIRNLLKKFFNKCNENFIAGIIGVFIVILPSIYWLVQCQSRAAWLALVLYSAFMICMKFKWKGRAVFCLAAIVVSIALFFTFKSYLHEAYRKDIRGPLWMNTASMIKKSPGIGFGPGSFQEKYPFFKTRAHSSRLVAALMTEHPHNEFLYISAETGLPSALIWLTLTILLILLPVRTREGHLAKFGLIILFILSMFDKTLISPPGNLLYWIFSGILAARWLRKIIKFEKAPGFWAPAVGISAMVLLIPVSMRAMSIYKAKEIQRKTALLENSVAVSKITGNQRKDYYLKVYNGYLDAADINPFTVEYPYMALHIAVEILKDPGLGEVALERCLNLSKTYGHLNYLAALYHLQKSSKDPKKRDQHKDEAKKFLSMEMQLYPDNLASLFHIQETLFKMKERDLTNQVFGIINDRSMTKFQSKYSREEGTSEIAKWISLVKENNSGVLAQTEKMFSGFKGIGNIDVLTPFYASQEGYFIDHNHSRFHQSDTWYWQEIEKFTELYKQEKSAESLCQKIIGSVKITDDHEFKWPSEVVDAKEANELSVVSMLRIAAHCQGHLSLILKLNTLDKVHWVVYVKNENEEFFCWPRGKKIIKKKFAEFLKDSEFIEEMIGDKIKRRGFYLFEYPQAFCFRNMVLSKVINRLSGKFPDFCSPPSVVKMNLEFYLGGRISIEYFRQPFHRLEEDIKKVTK